MNERELLEAAGRLPKSIEAPRDLWPGIEARLRRPWRRWYWIPVAAAAALVAVLIGRGGEPDAWTVTWLAGAGPGTLRVGEWVETDDSSRALVAVGHIGQVEVKPDTRIRLIRARADDHRLALARGAIYAKVDTVPRLFYVETPAGTAIDLGCEYALETDSAGNGLLQVVRGIVEFQTGGRSVRVPMGAIVSIRARVGPGIPVVEDAPPALRRALEMLDVRGAVAAARAEDALSLWHLLQRVAAVDRGAVYDRLAHLVPPPASVTRTAALALDAAALDAYWNAIHRIHFRRMILRGVREIDPRTGAGRPAR
jgi:hypothetical protein